LTLLSKQVIVIILIETTTEGNLHYGTYD